MSNQSGPQRSKVKCIVHFQPVEKYPPALNFLRALAAQNNWGLEIHLLTTDPGGGRQCVKIDGVIIHRISEWKGERKRLLRIFFYISFIVRALLTLIRLKPSSVLYYESLSSGAPCLYKKWFNRSCDLFVHYHEYMSPEDYRSGMVLNRWLYKLEQSLYKKTVWVSHCNEDRMRLFLQNLGGRAPQFTYVIPNHPPLKWTSYAKDASAGRNAPIGLVHVGALSLEGFFLKETAQWIAAHPQTCYLDIYSDNFSAGAIEYLQSLNASNITFKGGVPYDDLPTVLPKYTVGLILYTGYIPNHVYSVPNKLFEYHACGLDTWFPPQLVTCLPLTKDDSYPKILPLDFKALDKLSMESLVSIDGYNYRKNEYVAEETYKPLIEKFAS